MKLNKKPKKIRPCVLNWVNELWNMQLFLYIHMQLQAVLFCSYTCDLILLHSF